MSKYFAEYMTNYENFQSFIINESEFDNPQLRDLEMLIGELREKYTMINYDTAKINTDPIILKISQLFEDIFGFNSCQFTIDHSKFPNAYTIAISSKVDAWNYKKCIKKSSKGIKFTQEAKVNTCVYITSGLLFDNRYTDREIVAILLHEIGHNFSDSVNDTLGVFTSVNKILLIPSLLNPLNWQHLLNSVRGGMTSFTNYLRKNNPALVSAFNCLKKFIKDIEYLYISVSDVLNIFPGMAVYSTVIAFNNLITKLMNPISFVVELIMNFFGMDNEYTSDSFAALYGYGPDLSSALLKLERSEPTAIRDVIKSSEFGAMWYAFFVESIEYIGSLMRIDPHPTTAKRLLNILDTLEQELTKGHLNPKFRKATEQEIKEIRKLIEEEEKNHSFQGNYWRVAFNRYQLATAPKYGPKEKMVSDMLDKIQRIKTDDK